MSANFTLADTSSNFQNFITLFVSATFVPFCAEKIIAIVCKLFEKIEKNFFFPAETWLPNTFKLVSFARAYFLKFCAEEKNLTGLQDFQKTSKIRFKKFSNF